MKFGRYYSAVPPAAPAFGPSHPSVVQQSLPHTGTALSLPPSLPFPVMWGEAAPARSPPTRLIVSIRKVMRGNCCVSVSVSGGAPPLGAERCQVKSICVAHLRATFEASTVRGRGAGARGVPPSWRNLYLCVYFQMLSCKHILQILRLLPSCGRSQVLKMLVCSR